MRGLLLAQDIGASVMLMSASQEHFDRWAASRSKAATTSDPELTVPRHGSGDDDDNPAWDNVGIANSFAQPFESQCDALFFPELIEEIESADRETARSQWLVTLAGRAEAVLLSAFAAGPRSAQLRYRAQSAALGRLRSMMYGNKWPALAIALKSKRPSTPTPFDKETHEHT